jgi:poly-gamma-glutamate synthesis protein (capsule biosynthesis protein)
VPGWLALVAIGVLGASFVGGLAWSGRLAAGESSNASRPPSASGAAVPSPPASVRQDPPSPSPSPSPDPVEIPVVLVADVREPRVGISVEALRTALDSATIPLTCGLTELTLAAASVAAPAASCLDPTQLVGHVRAQPGRLGILPAALVTPAVKVLRVGGADPFGGPSIRGIASPLAATAIDPPAAWLAFDPTEVRTLVSTGDTCPDRGVSHQTLVLEKGWDWALDGGTATYTGSHMDRRFTGPNGDGWPVIEARRNGDSGAVRRLISDAEITLNDFECPMTARFRHHTSGTIFSIDPKVAGLLDRAGVDVVTLASNHLTDQGIGALRETMALFDEAGIARFGAGEDLDEALEPAVLEVGGVRFGFVGFNEIPGSAKAGEGQPGVAYIGPANVREAIRRAREVAEVVIVVPQWGWPEYHNDFTARQREQMTMFFEAGADHVIGHGTHWASAISLSEGERGPRFVISSHGNFLFGQDWSRQTQEGVVVELTFVGTRLAQSRLHPYIMLDQAQANLTDPATDGAYVLDQVWSVSDLLP